MRKLFRFKYEPCNGTCYAFCEKLPEELRKLISEDRKILVDKMVKAHDKLCDNPDYSFGVDVDEINNVFVAHFRTPEKLDLYSDKSFSHVVEQVCKQVLAENIPAVKGLCNYGNNGVEDLGRDILRLCQDEVFAEYKKQHCPCKSA